MKLLLVEVDGSQPAIKGAFPCIYCNARLDYERTAPVGTEVPVVCGPCGRENAFRLMNERQGAVRRPYGCSLWFDVPSSNLAAAGLREKWILIRFKKGGVYRYDMGDRAAAERIFTDLLAAESHGRFFHRSVRPWPAAPLCATYGCFEPSYREGKQVLCRGHLAASVALHRDN